MYTLKISKTQLFVFFVALILAVSVAQASNGVKVEILGAKALRAGKTKDHQKLVEDVILKQDDIKLFCDSAEINTNTNDFEAWGHVFINQNDSVKAWGDSLKYDGATGKGKLMGNARLIKDGAELKTSIIYIDQKNDFFYYLDSAHIQLKESTITSRKGYYYTNSNKITFKDSVRVNNPDYKIKADTLDYFTGSEKVVFVGPTHITMDDQYVYCERGFYHPDLKLAEFRKNARVENEESILKGDSIIADEVKEYSECFGNVELLDTLNKIRILGEYAFFDQKSNSSIVTDSALFIQEMEGDSLYMRADTIRAMEDQDSVKSFYVYHNVRAYKKDMQAVCDSLTYTFADSLIKFYKDPKIWNEASQLTGDTIQILSYDNKLHQIFIKGNSMVISETDTTHSYYDQIKGRKMHGFFKSGKLDVMYVLGNGQTLYYAKEEDGTYTGVNKAACSDIKIRFNKNEISKITFLSEPDATFFPLVQFPSSEKKFEGFQWHGGIRPKDKDDLFPRSE